MRNRKGFTLIEILAVIVILALLMAVAVPSVTKYIESSRKKTLSISIEGYISAIISEVNLMEYSFNKKNTIYAVPIECVLLERGGTNPFGEWMQANDAYFAYVLVQKDNNNNRVYGFTFKDSAGYGMYPTVLDSIDESRIQIGLSLQKPENGSYTNITSSENWTGFTLDDDTELVVLEAESEGVDGNGSTTCTLVQKADNYLAVEEVKAEKKAEEAKKNKDSILASGGVTSGDNTFLGGSIKRKDVESVKTVSNLNIPSGAISWDISSSQNGSTMAWVVDNDNDGLYELYLGSDGVIYANEDSSYLFSYFLNATEMDLSNLNTSRATNMFAMFRVSEKLTSLDVSNFDTSNVTNMSYMFGGTNAAGGSHDMILEEIVGIENFDTSSVTTMQAMFGSCVKLKKLDLSKWDVSNVVNMGWMLGTVRMAARMELEEVNISNWDISSVKYMNEMFQHCYKLKKVIGLESLDTSKVEKMGSMFYNCNNLTGEITIRNPSLIIDNSIIYNTSIVEGTQLKINYISSTSDIVDTIISKKSTGSDVIKGELVS